MAPKITLDALVREDKTIESEQDNAILRLMEHRWKAVNEHGFGKREYARALGHKSDRTVRSYVRGWEMVRLDSNRTPADALVLATMSEEQREATEIVAEVHGVKPSTIMKGGGVSGGTTSVSDGGYQYRQEVRRVRADIDDGTEALIDAGVEPAKAREDAAEIVKQRLATEQRGRTKQAETRERLKQDKARSFRNLEYELLQMKHRGRNALLLAKESDLEGEDELIEFIERAITDVRHVLELVSLAIVGEAKIDWDAELSKLDNNA